MLTQLTKIEPFVKKHYWNGKFFTFKIDRIFVLG